MLYAGNSLTLAINAARDAGPSGQRQFERLHRRSVRLNGLVLVLGLGLLISFATRQAPRTPGIIELGPAVRMRATLDQTSKRPTLGSSPALRRTVRGPWNRPRAVERRPASPRDWREPHHLS